MKSIGTPTPTPTQKMKLKITLALTGIILTGVIHFAGSPSKVEAHEPSRPIVSKNHRISRKPVSAESPEVKTRVTEREAEPPLSDEESGNLENWKKLYDTLLAESGNKEKAAATLIKEVDTVFTKWLEEQIVPLADVPPTERYDRLMEMEGMVGEGAAAILEKLGIEGARHVSVTAGAMEAVSAELQYAESAPDHASRLAMLRLDRERENRMGKLLTLVEVDAKTAAMSELNEWYDTGISGLFHSGGDAE